MELYQEDRERVRKRPPSWRGYALSSWPRRVGAALVDTLVPAVLWLLAGLVFGLSLEELSSDGANVFPNRNDMLSLAASAVGTLLYYPVFMRVTNGATPGKLLVRVRVVRTDDRPMSFVRAAWREVGLKTLAVSTSPALAIVVLPVNYLWPLWDPQNRAIHDMLAGTRVVRSDIPRVEQLTLK